MSTATVAPTLICIGISGWRCRSLPKVVALFIRNTSWNIWCGKMRLGVPDAELYLQAYAQGRTEFFIDLAHLGGAVKKLTHPIDVINQMFRMGGAHQFAWDFAALAGALTEAGFHDIQRGRSGHASSDELCLDDPDHAFETLYIEATKPLVPQRLGDD